MNSASSLLSPQSPSVRAQLGSECSSLVSAVDLQLYSIEYSLFHVFCTMRRMRHALKGSFGCHVISSVTCHNQMSRTEQNRTTEGCWLIASYAPTRRSFTSVFYENLSQCSLLSALNPAYFYRNTKCAGWQRWSGRGRERGRKVQREAQREVWHAFAASHC